MENTNVILVTWDFTEKSEYALEHATRAAKNLECGITLMHIAKKDSEIKPLTEKLQGVINQRFADRNPKPEALVKTGNIFNTIGETAEEIGAKLVFMGTHGIKGSQKFFGSWALKVISNTKVPFIVVQDKPSKENIYKDIVFPVNYRKENKESVAWVSYFSKNFGSKIHVILAKHTDSIFKKGIESNMVFLTKNFTSNGVDFEMIKTEGEKDFVKEIIDYSKKIDANAIFVMTTKDIGLSDYMMGAHEQYIIANNFQIPVICVNPKPPRLGGSFSASG